MHIHCIASGTSCCKAATVPAPPGAVDIHCTPNTGSMHLLSRLCYDWKQLQLHSVPSWRCALDTQHTSLELGLGSLAVLSSLTLDCLQLHSKWCLLLAGYEPCVALSRTMWLCKTHV